MEQSVYYDILRKYWGYEQFRPLQLDIIESVVSGHDTFGLMPTGGGKSITFQVPAMCLHGVCLVITPLIALMKDQVINLFHKGIHAEIIYSGLSHNEIVNVLERCERDKNVKFLYLAPERLATPLFLQKMKYIPFSMIVVDEAHCISQWGFDFRPSYLNIAQFRMLLPNTPVLALTATAPPDVVHDIKQRLLFREGSQSFQMSFRRSNLVYVARATDDKIRETLHILNNVAGTAIVYTRHRESTTAIASALNKQNITATSYHAGLSNLTRDERLADWKENRVRVMVATNAFGMGIDKPDVRVVIHVDAPDSIEAYYQEAGRAGRDGKKSYAVLLYDNNDSRTLRSQLTNAFPKKEFIQTVYQRLCDYYIVGEGFGEERTFPFNVADFCKTYHFNEAMVNGAMELLKLSGYIILQESNTNGSSVMFLCSREALYDYNERSRYAPRIIDYLLRRYEGIMSSRVTINEELVSKELCITRHDVYNTLRELHMDGIINHRPYSKLPLFRFNGNRVDAIKVDIPPKVYEERYARETKKIEAIIDYFTSTNRCRSQILLNYLGETNSEPCGCCDVCLANKRNKSLKEKPTLTVNEAIVKLLEQGAVMFNQLHHHPSLINYKTDEISEAISQLVNDHTVVYSAKEGLTLNKEKQQK
ncbi:MAG: RecQ family ATP-dependent DNA helicase [Bacteroidales bacterium]|nr:RecQ family ATP-dependent DNA helicase [Bacteroidales bacterium]